MRTLLFFLLITACSAFSQSPEPCSAPEYHQLDFWIGDWDVYDVGAATPDAHVTVERILGGCVLHEKYEDNGGQHGESFSTYDSGRKQWRQSWYTSRGKGLELIGGQEGDAIVLAATDYDSQPQSQVRGTWKREGETVRETAVISKDGGKTWKQWFDLSFRLRDKRNSSKKDEQAILQLNAEYQKAVKDGDRAAIERLLPDDFVLVSSSGKTYSKSDILGETATVKYEAQDDSEQVVRVWGDTAVLTAKLRAKGTENGKPFDLNVVFSDTYARTANGWRYVLGQASRLPSNP